MNGKSGNMNNVLAQVYPTGCYIPGNELIAVFDADQVAKPDFFLRTVSLFDAGDDVGMVSSCALSCPRQSRWDCVVTCSRSVSAIREHTPYVCVRCRVSQSILLLHVSCGRSVSMRCVNRLT